MVLIHGAGHTARGRQRRGAAPKRGNRKCKNAKNGDHFSPEHGPRVQPLRCLTNFQYCVSRVDFSIFCSYTGPATPSAVANTAAPPRNVVFGSVKTPKMAVIWAPNTAPRAVR